MKTVAEVYDDYKAWQRQDAARASVSFEDYLKSIGW